MGGEHVPLVAFNRGIISPRGLARTDLKRTALSAETMNNWLPHVLGSMMLRPGTGYTIGTDGNNQSITIPFIYSGTDLARLEITNNKLRPLINDQPITRVSVSTALTNPTFTAYVTNGTFDSGTGWTTGAGWAIAAGVATATVSGASLTQTAGFALVNGKSYQITFTITRSAGSVKATIGGTLSGTARSAAGTFTETIVAGATQLIGFTGTGFTGTVDNVTVTPIDVDWQNKDETGATSLDAGQLTLMGTGGSAAIREQHLTISGGDQNKEHAVRIVVARGPVYLRIGSTSGGDDYRTESLIGTGTHSIAFTPTGADVYIRIFCYDTESRIVTSATIEAAGIVTLPTPWLTADLQSIRWEASADVTYVTCFGYQQRKIERRSTRSWSVVLYEPQDGPFRLQNDTVVQLTPSAITGDITLTASKQLFKATQVGALFKISSIGQTVDTTFAAENLFSNPIKVTGRGTQRTFTFTLSGTYSATLTLQRSVGDIGAWVDVPGAWAAFTAATTYTYTDGLTDQIIYYRIGIKTGNYTSGSVVTEISYDAGSIDGIVKITGYTSTTVVSASVLQPLGSTDPSALWKEGSWSDYRGWPSELQLHEGRLFFFGFAKIWGSIPEAYESYDESIIGDSGVINRSYGKGPVDKAMWSASLQRLLIGGEIAEWSLRSDGFDSPLTPANITTRSPSTQGGANVRAIQIDSRCLFVGKSGNKIYEMDMQSQGFLFDYSTTNLSETCPELTLPGISRIAVQRSPDTRVHCVLADGTVAVLISQPAEDVTAWILFSLPGGTVEDVCVMPGLVEDSVYYTVKRTIQGATVRYHEKFSLQMTECQGGTLNKQMDSFVTYSGAPSATITAAHLKGETLCIWGDGKDLGTAVADAGTGVVTLPNSATASNMVAGLPYTASFKSSKLAYAAQAGSALSVKKRIDSLSLICYNTHYQGLKYGKDFTTMYDLAKLKSGAPIAVDTVHGSLDVEPFTFPGTWDADSRLCLQASSPRPCTVLGAIMGLVTNG